MIRVSFSKTFSSKKNVECWYDIEDYYFIALFSNKETSQRFWRISRDTLTFNIFPETKLLQSIDAYAPCHNWIRNHKLFFPTLSSDYYEIRFNTPFDDQGIGIIDNNDFPIQYQVSDNNCILRLIFEKQTESYFAIAPNVVIGVYNNILSELLFDSIQCRNPSSVAKTRL